MGIDITRQELKQKMIQKQNLQSSIEAWISVVIQFWLIACHDDWGGGSLGEFAEWPARLSHS